MAKKRVNWEDLFNDSNAPSWALQERQDFLNNNKKYNAMIDAVQNDAGVEFDAATRMSMLKELRSGKPLNFSESPEEGTATPVVPSKKKTNFSDVHGGAVSTEEGSYADTLSTQGQTLWNATKNLAARFEDQLARVPELESKAGETLASSLGIALPSTKVTGPLGSLASAWEAAGLPTDKDNAAAIRAASNDPLLLNKTEQLSKHFDEIGGIKGFIGGGVTGAAQSPSSFLSLIGGPTAAITVADSYSSAYEQGYKKGLRGSDLETWAISQGAPELIGVIPAGKLITKLPIIGPLIENRLKKFAVGMLEKKVANPLIAGGVNAALAVGGEVLEENSTGTVQDLAAAAFAGHSQSESLQEMGKESMPHDAEGNFSWDEFGKRRYKEAQAAAVMAGAISGPVDLYNANSDYQEAIKAQKDRRLKDTLVGESRVADGVAKTHNAERQNVLEEDAKLKQAQSDFIGAPRQEGSTDLPRTAGVESFEDFAAREAGLLEAENERTADAQEAFNRMPRVETEPGSERPATPGVESFEDFAQREAEGIVAREQRAADEAEAASRLEKAKKRITLEEKRKAAAAKAAETTRRNNLAKQVATEHADKTPQEQKVILADLMATPEAKAVTAKDKPKTLEDKVQGVINQVEGLRKQKATQRVSNRIRSLYRQNPDMTAKEIADKLTQEEGPAITEPVAPSEEELVQQVKALSSKKGVLNIDQSVAGAQEQEAAKISDEGPVITRTPEKQKKHVENLKKLFNSLGNTQENVDIHNLIKQGKIVLTDRPESVGREATTSPGQYSPADGKTYIYLDNFDAAKPREAMLQAVAAHESGHTGQFNPRDGRSNLFQNLLGSKGTADANKTIRNAAANGNKLAGAALKAAQNAAKKNNSFTNVEDLELVPYLFSEAKIGNHAPGTVGKVIRDVKNAARAATRKVFNKELDFSIDELAAAGNAVSGEIVKTDVKPDSTVVGSADMIFPVGTKAGDKEANASRLYKSVDGRDKYVLTDEGAKLKGGASYRLLESPNTGERLTVDDMLAHDVLYDMVPSVRNIPVVLDSSISGFAAYDPNPNAKYISISPKLLQGQTRTQVREALLHEIQHYVQDETGGGEQFFNEADIAGINELDKKVQAEAKKRQVKADAILDNVAALTQNATLEQKRKVSDIVRAKVDDPQKVVNLREFLTTNAVKVEGRGSQLINDFNTANRAYFDVASEKQALVNEGYFANINEREAFRTQIDSNKSQAELDARGNPELAMRTQGQELDFPDDSGGHIDVPEGNGSIVARGSLDMAASDKKPASKFSVKERITRILSHGRQDRLDVSKTAEDLHSQFVDALKADTGQPVLTEETDNAFKEFLTSEDQKTVEGRERIIRELSAKYPETTKILTQVRDLISDLTFDTINDMVNSGRPLSVEQRNSIATMIANKDNYMSRSYAAFQGGRGRSWAETRWANFYKNLGRDVATIKNDKVRQDVIEVRDAIKTIVNGLKIPDVAALEDMTMDKLVSLAARHNIKESQLQYDRADPDASWLKRDEIISQLQSLKKDNPEGRLEDMAMDAAAELLGLGDRSSTFAKQMSQMTRDPGTLKKREHVPLEIRRLLGEIDVAPGAFLATLSNQAALRARAKVVNELIHDPNNDLVLTQDDYYKLSKGTPKSTKTLLERAASAVNPLADTTQDDYIKVDGEQWGALNGMYLRKEAFARMNEAVTTFQTWGEALEQGVFSSDVAKKVGKGLLQTAGAVNRWTKIPTVVGNPVNYFAQWMGSYLNLLGAGNFSSSAWLQGHKGAWDYVRGTAKTTTTPRLSEVLRHMNLESADIAEIQRILGSKLEDYFDGHKSMQDATLKLNKHASGLAGRTGKTALAVYAIMDNWSKISNFYHRASVLQAVNEAAGSPKTREQVLQEAGDDTSYTNISPERAAEVIKAGESAGFTQFAPYFAEVFRTRYTGFALAVKDRIQAERLFNEGHPEAANILARAATQRLVGHMLATLGMPLVGGIKVASRLTALGVPAALATGIAQGITALGADDDENKLKRRLLSDQLRYQEIMQIGKDSRGYPIFWGSSQKIDPSGPMTDLLRIMTYADNDRTMAKDLENYAYENLLIIPQIWKDVYMGLTSDNIPPSDIGKALDTIGLKSQFVQVSGVQAQTVDRYLNVLDNFIPGMLRAYKDQYEASDIQTDPKTKKAVVAANLMGFRFETFNPSTALQGRSRVSNDTKRGNSTAVNANLLNIKNVTENTVIAATQDYFKKEMQRQVEDYQNVKSLRAWGFNDEQVKALLKSGGYKEEYASNLVEGAASVKIPVAGFLEYAVNSSKYLSDKDRADRKAHAGEVANLLIKMKPQLEELGIDVDTSKIPQEWKE